jgi:hypothetical protein
LWLQNWLCILGQTQLTAIIMTDTEALITAARRYLQDNHSYWADRYSKERTGNDFPYTYTDNDYNLFPRYNVLSAILDRVEALVGQADLDFEACKKELKSIGLTAENPFTTGEQDDIEKKAIKAERLKFINFIENTKPKDLKLVEPLPFRRRLNENESNQVRSLLLDIWNYEGNYWEPVEELSPKPTIFIMKHNLTEDDYEQIIEEVKKHTGEKLFEINEHSADAEIEFSLFHPNCYETIYCDKTLDWIIYGSHEDTLAFGGEWLLNFIERLFVYRQDKLNKWEETG